MWIDPSCKPSIGLVTVSLSNRLVMYVRLPLLIAFISGYSMYDQK
jgi:hypothetical protein